MLLLQIQYYSFIAIFNITNFILKIKIDDFSYFFLHKKLYVISVYSASYDKNPQSLLLQFLH